MNIELDLSETKETIFYYNDVLEFIWYGYKITGFFIQRFSDQIEIEIISDTSNALHKGDFAQFNICYFTKVYNFPSPY